jgi:HPt (histidine-containing phosphotransfer) domain-containing protein
MTAHAMKGDEEKCLEAGMDGYIAKPINQDRLFSTLSHLLRGRRRAIQIETALAEELPAGEVAGGGETAAAGPSLDLPGIDVESALQTSGLDRQTFATILVGFYHDNGATGESITRAATEGRFDDLLQLSHGLKGSAGNIGATALRQAAAAMEEDCRKALDTSERAPDFEEKLQRLLDSLSQVLDSLRVLSAPGDAEGGTATPPAAVEDISGLFLRMEEAIDTADPEAIGRILQEIRHQAKAAGSPGGELLPQLERQVNRYDYDQARSTLQQMKQQGGAG